MGKTIQVANDRALDPSKTILPAEVARGVYIENPPAAQALKLMHLMISTAGGRMADDVQHQFRLSDIRKIAGMKHHDRASLALMFRELRAAVLTHDDIANKRLIIGGLLDEALVDYRDEISGDLLVTWYFGRTFRRMAEQSNHWAILDRQTVFALSSKYAILLFQHVASLANLQRVDSKTFSIPELRAMLGVPAGKLERFADLNRRAVQAAIDEINQISRLNLTVTPVKAGRTVAAVKVSWAVKGADDTGAAARELKVHSAGRKARRAATVQIVAADPSIPPFPRSGGLAYSPEWQGRFRSMWADLGRAHTALPDSAAVADRVRRIAKDQDIGPDSPQIAAILGNVVKNWKQS